MYKGICKETNEVVYGDFYRDLQNNKVMIREYNEGQGYPNFIPTNHNDTEIIKGSERIFTGYYMFDVPVFFGDKVSNNFGTDKEVIREVVEHEGSKTLKRIKGKSRLPEYISLHEHHALNYRVIN